MNIRFCRITNLILVMLKIDEQGILRIIKVRKEGQTEQDTKKMRGQTFVFIVN